MTKKADKALREKEATTNTCDVKVKQMMGVLEQYKIDQDQIVAEKQKELDDLKKKISEQQTAEKSKVGIQCYALKSWAGRATKMVVLIGSSGSGSSCIHIYCHQNNQTRSQEWREPKEISSLWESH